MAAGKLSLNCVRAVERSETERDRSMQSGPVTASTTTNIRIFVVATSDLVVEKSDYCDGGHEITGGARNGRFSGERHQAESLSPSYRG